MLRKFFLLFLLTSLLLGLPVLGVWWTGMPVAEYLHFPPQSMSTRPTGFSWLVFSLFLLLEIPLYGLLIWMLLRCRKIRYPGDTFPHWGMAVLTWLLFAWYLAWCRPVWLGPLREHTFILLWMGYIGVINALCQWRSGYNLLTQRPGYLLSLFPLSALFWWYFEYLNRFVENWHYLGIEDISPWSYFWRATLPFSTVLPAVISTLVLLRTFFGPAEDLPSLKLAYPRLWAWGGLMLGCAGLVGVGVWPQWLFALLWLAPLILFVSIQVFLGESSYFLNLSQGRWDGVVLPMLAALICGFFWEMWNYWSEPKWLYTVPWVSHFRIFEMPVLGYAGYLPFGLECAVVADWWGRNARQNHGAGSSFGH